MRYKRQGGRLTTTLEARQDRVYQPQTKGTKLDISLITEQATSPPIHCHKLGGIRLSATVTEDRHAFDYPARLGIRHDRISEVIAFTKLREKPRRSGRG